MTKRTTIEAVTFARPFALRGFDAVAPAGTYEVETEEELLEGISFPAYRRTMTAIHLCKLPGQPGIMHVVNVDPIDLDAALAADKAAGAGAPVQPADSLVSAPRATEDAGS